MSLNIEKDWTTEAGLRAVVLATVMGHRCGYVGVPESHPHYDKDYNDVPDINVHGGLTYSSHGIAAELVLEKPLYWFGFDCAHYMDAKDLTIMDEKHREIHEKYSIAEREEGAMVRDLPFCERQCEKLAKQLGGVA
jgi:hypothetical protein